MEWLDIETAASYVVASKGRKVPVDTLKLWLRNYKHLEATAFIDAVRTACQKQRGVPDESSICAALLEKGISPHAHAEQLARAASPGFDEWMEWLVKYIDSYARRDEWISAGWFYDDGIPNANVFRAYYDHSYADCPGPYMSMPTQTWRRITVDRLVKQRELKLVPQ